MDEDTKLKFLEKKERIKQQNQEDYQRREKYHEELKKTTLKSFKDRPDEVKSVRVIGCKRGQITIEWDKPNHNNCQITAYKIYLGQKTIQRGNYFTWMNNIDDKESSNSDISINSDTSSSYIEIDEVTQTQYTFLGLESKIGYYVKVTAVNDIGEGY